MAHPSPKRRGLAMIWIMATVIFVILLAAVGYRRWRPSSNAADARILTTLVTKGRFQHDVVERGEVKSSNNVEVRCGVKSRNTAGTAIIEVVPEGTLVAEGDIIAKLDATALEQELVQQRITCNTKEAAMIDARNTFEAAEIAKKEYVEGTFFQEEQTIKGEILIAEENLRRAEEYIKYSERLAARGYVTSQQMEGDRFAVEKAQTELDTAQTKLRVLREYTRPKMMKQLDSDIKSAEALWKSEQSSFDLESSKLADMEQQIQFCTIRAPQAGIVIHANERSMRGDSEFVVEPGTLVRENQVIFRFPDSANMHVLAKINEARVTLVREGMTANVRLDAFGDEIFKGKVTKVSEYPEPSGWFSSQVKEYATEVQILDPPAKIRTGLTAEVTIHVEAVDDAKLVPMQAVIERNRRFYSILREDDTWRAEPLRILASNEKFVMFEGQLEPGQTVALNPRDLLERVKFPDLPPEEVEVATQIPEGPVAAESVPEKLPKSQGRSDRDSAAGAPARQSGGGDPTAIVAMILERADKNKDGKISKDEIPADQAARLAQSDANGDGEIDREELTQGMRRRMSAGNGQ